MSDQAKLPEGYIPQIGVKFHDDVKLPFEDGVEKYFEGADAEFWKQLSEKYPGISLRRRFRALAGPKGEVKDPQAVAQGIERLIARAKKNNPDYQPPNLLNHYVIDVPPGTKILALVAELRGWPAVESAYVSGLPGPPPAVSYLDTAPDGIAARDAWNALQPPNNGAGVKVVDIEQGWVLAHPKLPPAGIALLSGINFAGYRVHGLAVLSVLVAQNNGAGVGVGAPAAPAIEGIASAATVEVVSEWRDNGSRDPGDAIIWMLEMLEFGRLAEGDVLLLETQYHPLLEDESLGPPQPIEMQLDAYQAIELATEAGIIVIEAAGNGALDLASLQDENGRFVLGQDLRDSGAIMVGADDSVTRGRRPTSNFGDRVNCFAQGDGVLTLALGTNPLEFDGTSSASAIIAGAAALVQSARVQRNEPRLTPDQMRGLLADRTPGVNTPSNDPANDKIGVMPNLVNIIG